MSLSIPKINPFAWLNSTMKGRPSLESLKAADFGLFGATLWPFASLDRLRVVTYLSTWVRVWIEDMFKLRLTCSVFLAFLLGRW